MKKKSLHTATQWPLRLGAWLAVAALGAPCCRADDASSAGGAAPQPSFFQSLFGGGTKRTVEQTAPKPAAAPSDDPLSLQSTGKPDVKLYVAMARLLEEKGQLAEAEKQYQKGLEDSPQDLKALLLYAQLKDRLGEPNEATKLYQRAIHAHPKEGAVYNNLAIHYARQSMYRESLAAFQKAIVLQPKNVRYRNNAAVVLVQLNRSQDAFFQLCAVHDPAMAHYNLGVLLAKNGQPQPAVQQFSLALHVNPSLLPARQWLERLGAIPRASAPRMAADDPRVAARMVPDSGQPPSAAGANGGQSGFNQGQGPVLQALPPPPGTLPAEGTPVVVGPADARAFRPQPFQGPPPSPDATGP